MDQTFADDPRFGAAITMLRSTGMLTFQIRYSDADEPVVWMCVGEWNLSEDGRPVNHTEEGKKTYVVACGLHPFAALMRLCDEVVDGGTCNHCHKPTGITTEWQHTMPMANDICWYQYDPETKTFRRGCSGDN